VARVTNGKVAIDRQMVAIRDVVDQAVENCEALVTERRHDLSVSYPREPLHVNGDRVRLVQVVTNLLVNAAKYTRPGGRIRVAVERRADEIHLSVEDTGIGIVPRMLSRVFELFTQAPGAEPARGGMGVGLSVVKQLVESHGGGIEARSEGLGLGSTFVVRLPAVASTPDPPRRMPPARIPARRTGCARVLVVDDDFEAATTMATILRLVGHEVRLAHDAANATLAASRTPHPDVVLVDIGSPEIDGFELARRLRRMRGMERAVLVALTGAASLENGQPASGAGFQHRLSKPVDFDRLQAILVEAGAAASELSAAVSPIADGAVRVMRSHPMLVRRPAH
jgi:CheY-like chemotaxis protein